jgi:hypothetical protein
MIIDKRTEFADAVALNTGAAGTYNIGDVYDSRGSAGVNPNTLVDLGTATDDLYLVVSVSTTATSAGSATGTFRLVSDDSGAPSTTTATVHAVSATFAVAAMTAGTTLMAVKLPAGSYERYLGIQQITGTAAFTAGAIDAFLTNDPTLFRAYADNV